MDLELKNKVAIVTGGSQGIDRASALLASEAASYITGTSINLDGGTSAVL